MNEKHEHQVTGMNEFWRVIGNELGLYKVLDILLEFLNKYQRGKR